MSYIDTDYVDAIAAQSLLQEASDWNDASTAEKEAAIYDAYQAIENLNFIGDAVGDEQFPRGDDSTVPTAIKDANAYEAMKRINHDPDDELETLGLLSQGLDSARVTYNVRFNRPWVLAGIVSPKAWRLLIPFLRDMRVVKISRVS